MGRESGWLAVREAIDGRMAELGLTTATLARKAGVSAGTVRSLRTGKARAQRMTLYKLSSALGWPGGYLQAITQGRLPEAPPLGMAITERLDRIERKLDVISRYWLPASLRLTGLP
jgi:transcriptional regulator with XRE-family HTH domain